MKKLKKENLFILTPFFLSILTILGAVSIYYYASGYRFNIFKQQIEIQGILNLESSPSRSNIYINNKDKGKTPKSMTLPIGVVDVKITKEDYVDWEKEVIIKEGLSTPIFPWLIMENIENESVYNTLDTIIYSQLSEDRSKIIFITESQTPRITYNFFSFNINTPILNFEENPFNFLTLEYDIKPEISLLQSPSGDNILLTVTSQDQTIYYIKETFRTNSIKEIALEGFSSYEKSWSNDGQYLLLENENEIVSLDIQRDTKYLLLKKLQGVSYLSNTDTDGYLYILTDNQNPELLDYSLSQIPLRGGESNLVIDHIYMHDSDEYIKLYREDRISAESLFTNSPENTKTAGTIQSLDILSDAKGIYIQTEFASYWYDIETEKYLMVSPYPSTFVQLAQNEMQLIYKSDMEIGVFYFDKEDGDHTVTIGSKILNNIEDFSKITDIYWLYKSQNIAYVEDSTLYICDIDGDNKTKITDNVKTETSVSNNQENVFSVQQLEDFDILKYTIH